MCAMSTVTKPRFKNFTKSSMSDIPVTISAFNSGMLVAPFFHRTDADGSECADQRGEYCGAKCDLQRHDQCVHDRFVCKTGGVPF